MDTQLTIVVGPQHRPTLPKPNGQLDASDFIATHTHRHVSLTGVFKSTSADSAVRNMLCGIHNRVLKATVDALGGPLSDSANQRRWARHNPSKKAFLKSFSEECCCSQSPTATRCNLTCTHESSGCRKGQVCFIRAHNQTK